MAKITQNFSVPMGLAKVENPQQLNSELRNYFHFLVDSKKNRNDLPTQPERMDLYESKFDLFEHKDRAVQSIKTLMHNELKDIIMQVNGYPESIRSTLNIKQHAWFHITLKNGYFTNHNHPMASWSGIYCVSGGGRPQNFPESAVTRFFHPNPNSNYYMDAGNASIQGVFSSGSVNFQLEAGDMAFFPSYLMHEVSPHKGDSERITIAVNFWIDSDQIKVRI